MFNRSAAVVLLVIGECSAPQSAVATKAHQVVGHGPVTASDVTVPNWLLQRRAIQEIALYGTDDPAVADVMFKALQDTDPAGGPFLDILRVFETIRSPQVRSRAISLVTQPHGNGCGMETLFIAARFSPLNAEEAGRLRACGPLGRTDEELAVMWTVLAYDTQKPDPEDRARVLRILGRFDESGVGVLGALAYGSTRQIDDDALYRLVIRQLDSSDSLVRSFAMMALAVRFHARAARDEAVIGRLRSLIHADKKLGLARCVGSYAMARITHDRADVEYALKNLSFPEFDRHSHFWGNSPLFSLFADILVDDVVLEYVIDALSSGKEDLQFGAVDVLCYVGRRARRSGPALAKIAANHSNPNLRRDATETLLYVADLEDIRAADPAIFTAFGIEYHDTLAVLLKEPEPPLSKGIQGPG